MWSRPSGCPAVLRPPPSGRRREGRDACAGHAGRPLQRRRAQALLDYCFADVVALRALLPPMWADIRARRGGAHTALGQGLLRGRYMAAVARMEHTGVPIDTGSLAAIRAGWDGFKLRMIAEVDTAYGVYEGTSFRAVRFGAYLQAQGIPSWPRPNWAAWRSAVIRSGTWPRAGRNCTHSMNCATRWASCVWNNWPSEPMAAIAPCFIPFATKTGRNAPEQHEIHLRPGDLDPRADPARRKSPGLSPMSTSPAKRSALPPHCRGTKPC